VDKFNYKVVIVKKTKLRSAVILGLMVSPAVLFAAETSVIKETESMINVQGDLLNDPWYSNEKKLKYSPTSTPDTASMLERMPGANVNENGPLSGIVQYRGMFDNRVNVKVNDMKMVAACPNHMDPPLHYATRFRLDTLKIYRGIAPVSSGLETIGGSVIATTRQYDFGDSESYEFHGAALGGLSSVDSGYMAGVDFNIANDAVTFTLGAFTEKGDDYSFNGGDVLPSKYKRSTGHLAAGFQQNGHKVGIDYEKGDTDYGGNAALPMDITRAKSDTVKLNYDNMFGDKLFRGQLSYSYIDHTMDNYSLRTPPTPRRRESPTTSLGKGYEFTLDLPIANGDLKLGLDGHLATHNAVILDPDNAKFFQDNFNDAQRDLYGFFTEWDGEFADNWHVTAGLRYNRVNMDSGDVGFGGIMPGTPIYNMFNMLKNKFNKADKRVSDNNIDLAGVFTYLLNDQTDINIGVARKVRSPSYQERYLWSPTQASGGLADGRTYIGDINLDPEVSYETDMGIDWDNNKVYVTPRVFYRKV
jgi:iron complex outermembrane receptor protein